jgi:hypothetical protein
MSVDFKVLWEKSLEEINSWKRSYDQSSEALQTVVSQREELRQKLRRAEEQLLAVRKVANHFAIAGNDLMYKAVESALVNGLPPVEVERTEAEEKVLKAAKEVEVTCDAHLGYYIKGDEELACAIREYQRVAK